MTNRNLENNAARATAARSYIIFSVNKSDRPFTLRALARAGISYKTVLGYYKGTREHSYIVNVDDWAAVWRVLAWAIATQESILHLGPVDRARDARPVILEFMSIGGFTTLRRPPVFLGYWYAVSKTTALARDAWTRDTGQHYVAALVRPDHITLRYDIAANEAALDASNDTVRASNRGAVRDHVKAAAARDAWAGAYKRGGTKEGHLRTPHHTTRAFEIRDGDRPVWSGPRPLTVKGTIGARGARTPSGHEF